MAKPVYQRVIVKVSGESLMGPDSFGIHQPTLEQVAADLVATQSLGVAVGVVVGGGNIFRGVKVSEQGIPRVTADTMGMLATVMNALALETAIDKAGAKARTMSAMAMPEICETYERRRALRHLAANVDPDRGIATGARIVEVAPEPAVFFKLFGITRGLPDFCRTKMRTVRIRIANTLDDRELACIVKFLEAGQARMQTLPKCAPASMSLSGSRPVTS
jgi:hypothetical protein